MQRTSLWPKGSKAGLEHDDYGLVTLETTAGVAGNLSRVFRERWKWTTGIALKDWRFVVRIANIDVSNMVADSSAAALNTLMTKATYRLPSLSVVNPVFYMNRSVAQYLDLQTTAKVSVGGQLTYEYVQGKRIMSFRGIPIRIVDQITETEAAVT